MRAKYQRATMAFLYCFPRFRERERKVSFSRDARADAARHSAEAGAREGNESELRRYYNTAAANIRLRTYILFLLLCFRQKEEIY